MRVYLEWWHFCLGTRRIRRLFSACCCARCGVWPYIFAAVDA